MLYTSRLSTIYYIFIWCNNDICSHIVIQKSVTWIKGILMFDVGTNSDEYGADNDCEEQYVAERNSPITRVFGVPCRSCPKWISWKFTFDGHALFSLPLRHNYLHIYKFLSLYSMMSSLTEILLVWTFIWHKFALLRIWNTEVVFDRV